MTDWLRDGGLLLAGLFSLGLGTLHFFFPLLLDFDHAIPRGGAALAPFRLGPLHYATVRQDVRGIAWVMNHAASFVLVSVGLADLFVLRSLPPALAAGLALWITAWWALRAASQLYLGRRPGDWMILAGFALLAVFHLWLGASWWPA